MILAPVFTMALGMPVMAGMDWHGGPMAGTAPWWGLGMGLLWIAILVAVGCLVYPAAVPSSGREVDAALRELRLADARENLSDEEFETRRAVLATDQD